jgi:hypothetical protein
VRALLAAALLLLALAVPAHAADELRNPPARNAVPAGHRLNEARVARIADAVPKVARERPKFPGSTRRVFLKGATAWQVSYYAKGGKKEIAQVKVDDATGAVLEAWTGHQVAWSMARGYSGAFGRKITALFVWLPLCALFLLPFVDVRRPLRMVHLDLLVLLGFSVSLAAFNHGNIDASVPLAYPFLLYLLGRMLWVGFQGTDDPLRLQAPASWVGIGLLFLIGFRVGLNLANSNVIDVGYAGVIGADHILDGKAIYGAFPKDNPHGDTYGPLVYLLYVPFKAIFGWSGSWDDLPAAHGAALFFDLATLGLLGWLGRRLGGTPLALALTWAWAAWPFTAFSLMSNSNDTLVALLVTLALLAAASPAGRGAVVGLAGLAKFAPLGLAPVLLRRPSGQEGVRPMLLYAAGLAVVGVLLMAPVVLGGDLGTFADRTLSYQAQRGSPFSVWGLYGWDAAQRVVQVGAIMLCLAFALVPRPDGLARTAALAAAALIALQLGVNHWFYLYLVWFFPLVMVALAAPAGTAARSPRPVVESRTPVPARP